MEVPTALADGPVAQAPVAATGPVEAGHQLQRMALTADAAAWSDRPPLAPGRVRGESPVAAPDAIRPAGSVLEALKAFAAAVVGCRSLA
ncbi:MAG: hypothetical protein WAO15_26505 [Mycobacterium sp.]